MTVGHNGEYQVKWRTKENIWKNSLTGKSKWILFARLIELLKHVPIRPYYP